jgi:hypothetical protein
LSGEATSINGVAEKKLMRKNKKGREKAKPQWWLSQKENRRKDLNRVLLNYTSYV